MIENIYLGVVTGDKTGTPAKQAGQIINNNFAYLDNKIDGVLVESTIVNNVTTSSSVPSSGNIHAIGVGPGTYPNWGGMVIPDNYIGTLRRIDGVYSVTLTAFNLNEKITYKSKSTYALMVNDGTPTVPTIYNVENDENKSWQRSTYLWKPDGNREWIASMPDN